MSAPPLSPGQVIAGKYSVRAQLALSQAVATYLAQDAQGRELVVKLFDPAIAQRADLMTALERTTQAARQLPPEAVVHVLDSGYDPATGAPFSACERVTVPSLAQLCAQGPVGHEVVAAIAAGLARCLDLAHGRGLFHHALKPNNVFIGAPPGYAVRIADFGSSIVRNAQPSHESYVVGAAWWAPEQIQPGATLDAATDVFAAALVLFYALTGRPYWQAFQQTPPDLHAWQRELLGPRAPISHRGIEFRVPINGQLDGIFGRALAINPAERPRSVGELANALGTIGAAPKASESAKTMAFGELAPYNPPAQANPAAAAQALAAGSGFAAAASATPQGGGGGSGYPDAPRAGAYAPAGDPNAGGGGGAVEASAASATGLPPFPLPPKKEKKNFLPIIIGVGLAMVAGGVGLALLMTRTPSTDDPTTSTESTASTTARPAATSTPPPSDTTSNTATPPETASSATATDSASASASASSSEDVADAGADAGDAEKVVAKLTCNPGPCELLYVDNAPIKELAKDLELTPGKHKIRIGKSGFLPQEDTITIEEGQPFEKEYKLVQAPQPPQKKCGQFLKRCN